jgi:hypothetical protein
MNALSFLRFLAPTPTRLIQYLSVAVLLLGSLVVTTVPVVADVEDGDAIGPCVWCRNGCPEDLEDYCHGKQCPAGPGTGCSLSQCHGVDDEWYSNRITCSE